VKIIEEILNVLIDLFFGGEKRKNHKKGYDLGQPRPNGKSPKS